MDKYKVEKKEGLYDLYEREAEANEALYDKHAREAEANEALYDKYAREVERREKIYILDGVRGLLVNKEIPCSIKLKLIKKQMEINGELVVAVDGESMYPFIKNGDHVRIKRLKEMSIGKIVLFYTSDIFGMKKFGQKGIIIRGLMSMYMQRIFLVSLLKLFNMVAIDWLSLP